MGTIVEVSHDEKGIVWPEQTAPFAAHLLELGGASGAGLYEDLQKAGVDVLYDERNSSAGEKFADCDLIGIPWRLVVSPKTNGRIELKSRRETESRLVDKEEAIRIITSK
jgi:prolyl-tRNA synthetase